METALRFGNRVFEIRSCKSFDNLVLLCSVVLFVAPDCDEAGGVASLCFEQWHCQIQKPFSSEKGLQDESACVMSTFA